MPDAEGARSRAEKGEVGEHRAHNGVDHVIPGTQALLHLRADRRLVVQDFPRGRIGHLVGADRNNAVAIAGRKHRATGGWLKAKIPAESSFYGRDVGPGHMVAISAEVFGREFPIAGDKPLMHPADDLNAALAAI